MKGLFGRTGADALPAARRELAELQRKIARAQEELARLRSDVAAAEAELGTTQTAQLLEANEQLLLAALRAQSEADTATEALGTVTRSAELDVLTELPNRLRLLDRFAMALAAAKRHGSRMALLFIDLNKFKQINDTLGHAVGDEVLKRAAQCLQSTVRDADTVCRYGGDEFVILLSEVARADDAGRIAGKLMAAVGVPCRIGDHVLRLTASIGISIYPDDGDDAEQLIERADAAMYRAKRQGRGCCAYYGRETTEPGALAATLPALQQPATDYLHAQAEHARRHAQQIEANQQLVLAALSAQDVQSAAATAQRRHTEFMATLAHELHNPLAPMRTAAALLSRVRTEEPMLLRLQGVIERQVAQMTRLVGDLLDVSRSETGTLRIKKQAVVMIEVIDAAVEVCRPAMDMRLQHLLVDVPAADLQVEGDPARLVQIFSNLLDNASKYTQDGGEIRLSVEAADDRVVTAVSDNGIGISAQALEHIFEPFMQDPLAIGFNGSGLGIGLTVVRELIEAHGGEVAASSDGSGRGSRFVVTLPGASRWALRSA